MRYKDLEVQVILSSRQLTLMNPKLDSVGGSWAKSGFLEPLAEKWC